MKVAPSILLVAKMKTLVTRILGCMEGGGIPGYDIPRVYLVSVNHEGKTYRGYVENPSNIQDEKKRVNWAKRRLISSVLKHVNWRDEDYRPSGKDIHKLLPKTTCERVVDEPMEPGLPRIKKWMHQDYRV